ncbi:hypothetical protein KI387_041132, partial [Taxus chinensis]
DQKALLLKVRRKFLAAIKENIKLFKGKAKKPYPKREQKVLDKFTLGPVELHKPKKNSIWIRPEENVVKLNFDGASKGNLGLAGGGGILRNNEGDWLFVYVGPLGWQTNNMAEARALLWGVLLAKEKGFKDIQIEGDSLIIINALNNQGSINWPLRNILNDVKETLKYFVKVSYNHTLRQGNKCVDKMANYRALSNDYKIWCKGDDLPMDINETIIRDRGH